MLRNFIYWESQDGGEGTFKEDNGEGHQHDLNGFQMNFIYFVLAENFEEALAVHNLRMGFSPYYPMGEPQKCPSCTHGHYYLGSGECFCGYKHDA